MAADPFLSMLMLIPVIGNPAGILKAGQARGLETSVSVGDVSVSTDFSIIAAGIEGWAGFKTTTYGIQLAGIGRLLGKGGMYIH